MAEKTRKKTQLSFRRQQVAERYLRGMYMTQIAVELNVDVSTISRDLSELRKEWLDRSINHLDQKKAIELAKIDRLEMEYWEAWERSKKDSEKVIQERNGLFESGEIRTGRMKESKIHESESGNPAFLNGVMTCIVKRCEILGLNAPTKTITYDVSNMTDEELQKIVSGKVDDK